MKFDLRRVLICVGAALIIFLAIYQIFQIQIQANMTYHEVQNEGV